MKFSQEDKIEEVFDYENHQIPIYNSIKSRNMTIKAKYDWIYILKNPECEWDVSEFVESKKDFIKNQIKLFNSQRNYLERKSLDYRLYDNSIEELTKKVHMYVNKYVDLRGKPNNIYVREMTESWATCTVKRNLSFCTSLRFLPDELIEYNVYHEMCHLTEMKHNNVFYQLMSEVYPNYHMYIEELGIYDYLLTKYGCNNI